MGLRLPEGVRLEDLEIEKGLFDKEISIWQSSELDPAIKNRVILEDEEGSEYLDGDEWNVYVFEKLLNGELRCSDSSCIEIINIVSIINKGMMGVDDVVISDGRPRLSDDVLKRFYGRGYLWNFECQGYECRSVGVVVTINGKFHVLVSFLSLLDLDSEYFPPLVF